MLYFINIGIFIYSYFIIIFILGFIIIISIEN